MTITDLSGREISRRIRGGTLTCIAVVEAFLARIDRENPRINALRYVAHDAARRQANEIDRRLAAGFRHPGRLLGVPFSAKDNLAIDGMPWSEGTPQGALAGAPRTQKIIQALFDEGAICIGKANMAELGRSYYTDNPLGGRTNNPFDPTRTPGGSGGGDAAAVAAKCAVLGIGADAGGSIRIPAAFCGLFGLLPTSGLLSDAGALQIPHTFVGLFRSLGIVSRTLDDLEISLSALAHFDPDDPYSHAAPLRRSVQDPSKQDLLLVTSLSGVRPEQSIENALRTVAANYCRKFAATTHERTEPILESCYELFIVLAGQASLLIHDIVAQRSGNPRDLTREGKHMRTLRQRIGTELPPLTLDSALYYWYAVDQLRVQSTQIFKNYRAILAPVAATTAPPHDTAIFTVGTQTLQAQQITHFASLANLLGLPALTFPVGKDAQGMPIGLQLIGPRYSDEQLIAIARDLGHGKAIDL